MVPKVIQKISLLHIPSSKACFHTLAFTTFIRTSHHVPGYCGLNRSIYISCILIWSSVVIHALYVTRQHSSTLSKACPASAAAAVPLAPPAPRAPAPPEATRRAQHARGTGRDSCGSSGAPPASGGPFPERVARARMDSVWIAYG